MPASSETQRKAMCAALAIKRGSKSSNTVAKKLASDVTEKQLRDLCMTKEGLTFNDCLELVEMAPLQQPTPGTKQIGWDTLEVDGVHRRDYPDFSDACFSYGEYTDGTLIEDHVLDQLTDKHSDLVNKLAHRR